MRSLFARTCSLLRPYRWQVLLLTLGLLLQQGFDSLMPLAFKFLIDDAILPRNHSLLGMTLAALLGSAVVVSAVGVGRDYLYAALSSKVIRDLRVGIFSHLQLLSMEFYARRRPGDLLSRFTTDLAAVENGLVSTLPAGFLSLLGLLFGTALLVALHWKLAILAVVGLALSAVVPRLLGPPALEANDLLKEEQGRVADAVQENIAAQPVVKAFNLGPVAVENFRRQMARYLRLSVRADFLNSLMERTPTIGMLAFHLAIISVAAVLAFRGGLSIGALVTFNAVFIDLNLSVASLTYVIPLLMQAAAGLKRVDEILAERPAVADRPEPVCLPSFSGAVEMHEVDFAYGPSAKNLEGVTLRIPAGSTAAFVGPSGSGKSTILNLILRFYDPCRGRVTIDGLDLREISQASLRSPFSVVFQENFLFNASLAENIRLGKPEATLAEVRAAARAAEIDEFIMGLPAQYETPVGERGGRLSGGQRQRIAIARALIRDPAVMILDEATSALDPASEAAVNETLSRAAGGRTMIAVTHRLSTVTGMDRIFVLKEGRVIEEGTHASLLGAGGVYADLWRKQSGFTVSPGGDAAVVETERLRQIPIFSSLEPELLAEIAPFFVTELYQAGRDVVAEGDAGRKFYIIVRGTADVLKGADAGSPTTLGTLHDGDYFGEISLLKSEPRRATVRTRVSSTLLSLQCEVFLRTVSRSPSLRSALEERIAHYADR